LTAISNATQPSICITQQQIDLFSQASHDRNPLHLDAQYARRTIFGEPVVFGVLAALAAMSQIDDRPNAALAAVTLDFRNPLFVGVPYRVEVKTKSPTEQTVSLLDGGTPLLTAKLQFAPAVLHGSQPPVLPPQRTASNNLEPDSLHAGRTFQGRYGVDLAAFEQLVTQWDVRRKGILPEQVAAMMWASYLVGMELPGTRALFARLSLKFTPAAADGPLDYTAVIESFDDRFDQLRTDVTLQRSGVPFGAGSIIAHVRRDSPRCSNQALMELLPTSQKLRGKTALVTGGSRGLGAAIVQALALQGCTVFLNFHRSEAEAAAVRESLPPGAGPVHLVQGDAGDPLAFAALREQLPQLDFLIACASPPIRPMTLEHATLDRFSQFISQSIAMVSVPMATFLQPLSASQGCAVVVSSEYARTAPALFPHYVAAKRAIEGLVQSIAASSKNVRFLVLRPPKLLTDQTNTAMGREGAILTERVAGSLLAHLIEPPPGPQVAWMEKF
jgi:NAD(P)-dependent dehydrogenase (short-subunit alcohol dehydrogenase family)